MGKPKIVRDRYRLQYPYTQVILGKSFPEILTLEFETWQEGEGEDVEWLVNPIAINSNRNGLDVDTMYLADRKSVV